jgi:hypothetical protein
MPEGRPVLEDLGSRNGTFVNGDRVERAELKRGDSVRIENTVFRVLHELDITKISPVKKAKSVPGKMVEAVRPKRRLGEVLIDAGVIDENTLKKALEVQTGQNRRIGEVLVDLGEVTHDDLASALASKLSLPLISGDELDIPKELARLLQAGKVETSLVLPVKVTGNKLLLAMVDPLDIDTIYEIRHMTGYSIDVAVISRTDFSHAVAKFFAGTGVWY